MKKKKILIIIIIVIICVLYITFIIYKNIKLPSIFNNEYYIVSFKDSNKILSQESEKKLIQFLNIKNYVISEEDNIKITKIAYQYPFRHESTYYIFFEASLNSDLPYTLINITENSKEYVKKHICMNTNDCEEFNCVMKLVDDNFKWWENNEKKINL